MALRDLRHGCFPSTGGLGAKLRREVRCLVGGSFGIMVLMQLQGSDAALARAASFGSARFEQLEMHMDAMSRELEGNQAFRLAQRLLCRDPAKRPDAQAALKTSWLRPPSVQAQEAAPNSLTRKDSSSLRRSLSAYTKLSHFDKVVLLMASNVSAQRSDFCRKTSKIFMSTDTDSSGFLNQEELRRALAACGLKADDAEAEELWRALDASEDGRVTHSEWVSATLAPGALKSAKVAQELFAWLDTDGSGSVSLQELRRLVSEEDALEVLDSADTSRDGLLSFEEFTYLIRSIASRRYGEGLASSSDSEDEAAD
ncbi:CPK2 [Symbiodinium natans]|uniref:CPK2 protein n=1 Tax=Symbiodinium natans TaxID=878477 RepID=A0A812QQR9_9DINO|nr:CPK2 [Symbiodinium natans]